MRKLLTIVMLLVALVAQAGSWTEPKLMGLSLDQITSEDIVYLYNVEGKGFLSGGEPWGTRTNLAATPAQLSIAETTCGEGSQTCYTILTVVDPVKPGDSNGKFVFRNDEVTTWMNMKEQGHNYWGFDALPNGAYRIHSCADDDVYGSEVNANYAIEYFGWEGVGTVVSANVNPEAEGVGVDWLIVTQASYETYQAKLPLYTVLNRAEEVGVATAEAESVYNNPTATAEDIQATIASLEKAISNKQFAIASEDNPQDITASTLLNASFDDGKLDPWVSDNGKLAYTGDTYPNSSCNTTEYNNGEKFSKCINAWVSSSTTLANDNVHQTIANLPAGKYMLTCSMVAQHGSDMPAGVYLYAKGLVESVVECKHEEEFWNSLVSANTVNQLLQHPELAFVHTGGDLTVGVRIENTNCNWVYADNFKLVYYGPTDDNAHLMALKTYVNIASAYTNSIKPYSYDTSVQLASELIAAEALMAGSASDEEMDAARESLETLVANIQLEIAAYEKLEAFMSQVDADKKMYGAAGLEDMADELSDLYDELEDHDIECDLTIEEIQEYIDGYEERIKSLLAEAVVNATEENPVDVTRLYLVNPTFDKNIEGWTSENGVFVYSGDKVPNYTPEVDYNEGKTLQGIAHAWVASSSSVADGDIYQELTNLPAGSYTIEADVVAQHGEDIIEGVQLYGITGGNMFFTDCHVDEYVMNQYIMHCSVTVYHLGGNLRLGLRTRSTNANWVIMDNFKLVYAGASDDALRQAMESLAMTAATYDEVAARVSEADKLLQNALQEAADCPESASTDDIIAVMNTLQEAIAYCEQISPLRTKLANVYKLYVDYLIDYVESDDTEFPDLLSEVAAAFSDGFDNLEQMQDYIDAIPAGYTAYVQHPVLETASEAKPGNMSLAILNAGFEGLDNKGGLDFWTLTRDGGSQNYLFGIYEAYNANSFELQQTVVGLAEGFYRVRCQAFYRAGGNQPLADNLAELGSEYGRYAQLYANTRAVPLKNIFERADEDGVLNTDTLANEGEEPAVMYNDIEKFIVPNNRQALQHYFNAGLYWNQVDCYVGEDGKLTVGIVQSNHEEGDWCPFDNFELYYLGTAEPTSIESVSVEDTQALRNTAIYDLQGRRVQKAARGLYIQNGKKYFVK